MMHQTPKTPDVKNNPNITETPGCKWQAMFFWAHLLSCMEKYPGVTYPWSNEQILAQSLVHRHIGFYPTQFNPPGIFKRLLACTLTPGGLIWSNDDMFLMDTLSLLHHSNRRVIEVDSVLSCSSAGTLVAEEADLLKPLFLQGERTDVGNKLAGSSWKYCKLTTTFSIPDKATTTVTRTKESKDHVIKRSRSLRDVILC